MMTEVQARTVIQRELAERNEPDPTVVGRRALLQMTAKQRDELTQYGAESMAVELIEAEQGIPRRVKVGA
jgi:hypothetical protein